MIANCWGTNFWALISVAHSLKKSPHKPINYFEHNINIPHILPKHSPHYYPTWALTNTTHYIPHIIQLGFSQKYSPYCYQNWATKLCYFHKKAQNHLTCGQNLKKPNKTPFKANYDTAPWKLVTILHPQSPNTNLAPILQSLNTNLTLF